MTVNDLSGTDVESVNIDLAGTLGGGTGDGVADNVIVKGTNGDDAVDVSGESRNLTVSGLAATTTILQADAALLDRLDVDTQAGTDTVSTARLVAGSIQLFVNSVDRRSITTTARAAPGPALEMTTMTDAFREPMTGRDPPRDQPRHRAAESCVELMDDHHNDR